LSLGPGELRRCADYDEERRNFSPGVHGERSTDCCRLCGDRRLLQLSTSGKERYENGQNMGEERKTEKPRLITMKFSTRESVGVDTAPRRAQIDCAAGRYHNHPRIDSQC
jgi:hypothetical protein